MLVEQELCDAAPLPAPARQRSSAAIEVVGAGLPDILQGVAGVQRQAGAARCVDRVADYDPIGYCAAETLKRRLGD